MNLNELSDRYERWLTATQDLSEHTVRAYMADVSALRLFLGHRFNPAELSQDDLYKFVEHLSQEGRKSSTIRRRLYGVRRFCAWMSSQHVIKVDPTQDLTIRFSQTRRLPRAVSRRDLTQLVEHLATAAELHPGLDGPITGRNRSSAATTLLAVLLMVGTGVRVAELTTTRLTDVDLPSRTIRVAGKGRRERMVYLSNEFIVALLHSYVDRRGLHFGSAAPLLQNRSGNPLTPSAVRGRLERAGTAAGIPIRLTPHMLRHTAATQLIEAGVDIRFVQRLLGHASLTTTEIYTYVADRSLRHAITEADVIGSVLTLR